MRTLAATLGLSLLAAAAFAQPFVVTSGNFQPGDRLPDGQEYDGNGCTGGNRSPQLTWTGAPEGTLGYAVTMFDPDAKSGSGWWHWTVFNIGNSTTSLPEGGPLPSGAIQGRNDFGKNAYGGACPPPGDKPHRYVVTVWALKVATLPLAADATGAQVGMYVKANALASASTVATYSR
jgi:Raf kinase inhibitor-like YbhB/YbcL family protein